MSRWTTRMAVVIWTLCAASACSKSGANTAKAAATASTDASASGRADTAVALDCGKVFSPNDAIGLLKAPVTVGPVPGSASWCHFGNAELADITVRTGSDDDDEAMWNEATASTERVKFVALPGVGDQAVFKAGTRAETPELASKKGAMFCIVSIDGGNDNTYKSLGGQELAKRLGGLCNKAFAALRA